MDAMQEVGEMPRRVIIPPAFRAAADHLKLSPAVISGDHVFLTGVTGAASDGSIPTDPADQFRNAFEKIGEVLREAGLSFRSVVEMTSYHVGLRNRFDLFNAVRLEFVEAPYPAWTAVEVAGLRREGAIVEIRVAGLLGWRVRLRRDSGELRTGYHRDRCLVRTTVAWDDIDVRTRAAPDRRYRGHAGVSSRILIVEDQEDVAQLIDIVLKNEGYTVAIARDGAQGLMLARDWKPDLILMDIMLPGVDGGKLISRLRKEAETRDLPIVAMSASRTLRDRTPELEADALLAKPFDVDALLVQVQFLLSRERGDDES
jgi:CheY-like chemotaxis protein